MSFNRTCAAFVAVLTTCGLASAQTAIQATTTATVRTGPGYGYASFGQVPSGHTYVGISKSGSWWKICYDGRNGYTNGAYWRGVSGQTGVKVTTNGLNVRTGPSTGYSIVGKVNTGQIFWWATSSSGWYKICWGGTYRWISGMFVTRVNLAGGGSPAPSPAPAPAPPSSSGSKTLNMEYYSQVTGYFCGPATAQNIIRYISGRYYSQWTVNSVVGANSSVGSSAYAIANGIRYFSGQPYTVINSGFSRSRVINNINQNKPVGININTKYLAYVGYRQFFHHTPLKGYTSGGYYINDVGFGPNKWASSSEVYNAVTYHNNLYIVRY